MHLHEVDVDEEGLVGLRGRLKELQRRLLDIAVEEGNADDACLPVDHRRVDIFAIDLELLMRRLPRLGGQRALRHLVEHGAQVLRHVGEPFLVAIGVCVEMIEKGVFHLVIALRIGQRVIGLAKMPFAGEIGLVAALLQHGRQRPFRLRQAAALTLEGHGRQSAAVGDAPRLHCGAAGRAARLRVEGEEGQAFAGQPVDVRRRHAATFAAAVRTKIAIAGVVRNDQQDVRLLARRTDARLREGDAQRRQRSRNQRDCGHSEFSGLHHALPLFQ